VRQVGGRAHGEGVDRPLDAQAALPDGLDVLGDDVDEGDVVAGPHEVGADRAADRAGADDRDPQRTGSALIGPTPSSRARVSSTAIDQIRSMSASGFW
jgi:hypothetical protein